MYLNDEESVTQRVQEIENDLREYKLAEPIRIITHSARPKLIALIILFTICDIILISTPSRILLVPAIILEITIFNIIQDMIPIQSIGFYPSCGKLIRHTETAHFIFDTMDQLDGIEIIQNTPKLFNEAKKLSKLGVTLDK